MARRGTLDHIRLLIENGLSDTVDLVNLFVALLGSVIASMMLIHSYFMTEPVGTILAVLAAIALLW